jgi:hypothetical protein
VSAGLGNLCETSPMEGRNEEVEAYSPPCWAVLRRLCLLLRLPMLIRRTPHQPDLTQNYCPGGQWSSGWGTGYYVQVCDGEKYPDGSYWHQWMHDPGYNMYTVTHGPEWHHDCVGDSGNNVFPAPPPPGGCAGAIPPA